MHCICAIYFSSFYFFPESFSSIPHLYPFPLQKTCFACFFLSVFILIIRCCSSSLHPVGDFTGAAVDDVGDWVGLVVGIGKGDLVGLVVGDEVGDWVGLVVGRGKGDSVGLVVGDEVGDWVELVVGDEVGDWVGIAVARGHSNEAQSQVEPGQTNDASNGNTREIILYKPKSYSSSSARVLMLL